MATWHAQHWDNDRLTGLRRDRVSGDYTAYEPDYLVGAPLALDADTDAKVAAAERAVRALNTKSTSDDLAGISRFLLRSEAIASSRIEGIAPSAKQVALAELGQSEDVLGISDPARLVANNMTIVREATTRLIGANQVTIGDVEALHRALLPDEPRLHGIRTAQNWIGGSDWHPLHAEFVPPPPDRVMPLLEDLMGYLNGAAHSPIAQAALVHAQFETIHPFSDGNGRVGRALIHTVLARRGLTDNTVLPISLVLATLSSQYVAELTSYRYDAAAGTPMALSARSAWIRHFAVAATLAAEQAQQISDELRETREDWADRLDKHRQGKRALRVDSATSAIMTDLPATPVLTLQSVERIHRVSRPAASRALEELTAAGILERRSIGPERSAFIAREILDLITWAERRLASTRFDTREARPHHGTPAAPRT